MEEGSNWPDIGHRTTPRKKKKKEPHLEREGRPKLIVSDGFLTRKEFCTRRGPEEA